MIEIKKTIDNLGCPMSTVNNSRRHHYVNYKTTILSFLSYFIVTICYRNNERYHIQSICVEHIVACIIINSIERAYS